MYRKDLEAERDLSISCAGFGKSWEEDDDDCLECHAEDECRIRSEGSKNLIQRKHTLAKRVDEDDKLVVKQLEVRSAIAKRCTAGKACIMARRIAVKSIPAILRVAADEIDHFSDEIIHRSKDYE